MDDQTPVFFTSFDELKENLDTDHADPPLLNLAKKDLAGANWFNEEYEGELSVDVYQSGKNIVVKSTIAGVRPEDLEIYLHNDLLTIRGKRSSGLEESSADAEAGGSDYFYKECYWGGFSRSIILPVEVQADHVEATLKNGILKIVMPIAQKSKLINVKVKED
jgi:HSP20 family protein